MLKDWAWWILLALYSVYGIYSIYRDDKKFRQQARESELALKVDELTTELSRQGLLSRRKNAYHHNEKLEIVRVGKYHQDYKASVPSLEIEVEGGCFEDVIRNVDKAVSKYHEKKCREAKERCTHCNKGCYGNRTGFSCSLGLVVHGRIPYDCSEFVEGEPDELNEGED